MLLTDYLLQTLLLMNFFGFFGISALSPDYLVDGTECNSTSELLLERSYEQSLVDLMIPSLMLLINILKKLREAKEQYQNKRLSIVLLRLHREVSPKLAAYATNFSTHYPRLGLGFGAVCHLVASVLAFWPVFGWIPGLYSIVFFIVFKLHHHYLWAPRMHVA